MTNGSLSCPWRLYHGGRPRKEKNGYQFVISFIDTSSKKATRPAILITDNSYEIGGCEKNKIANSALVLVKNVVAIIS